MKKHLPLPLANGRWEALADQVLALWSLKRSSGAVADRVAAEPAAPVVTDRRNGG